MNTHSLTRTIGGMRPPAARARRGARAAAAMLAIALTVGPGFVRPAHAQDPPDDAPEVAPDVAPPGGPGTPGDPEHSPRELIGALRFWRMVDAVGLSEAEIPAAMAKMKAIERAQRDFQTTRHETVEMLRALLHADKPDEGKIRDQLTRLQKAEADFEKARDEHRSALLASFSVEQQARYLVFEEDFPRHLQELRERARRGGFGPDGRSGPGERGRRFMDRDDRDAPPPR